MQINTLNKKAESHYENLECVSFIKDDIKELQEHFVEVINKPSLPKEFHVSSELVERLGEGLTQDGVEFVIFNILIQKSPSGILNIYPALPG